MLTIFSSYALKVSLRTIVGVGLLGLSSISSATAQSFRAHALLGLNATQIDGDNLWGYNQAGILGGVKVALPLSDAISVQAGMLYSAKGSRNGEYEPGFTIIRLSYLELPIEIQGQLVNKVYLFGGLSPNYLINARSDLGFGFEPNRTGFRNFDLCFVAGVLYRFADNVGVQVRVSDGLRSANTLRYLRNRALSFALVYYFNAE